MQSDSTNTNSSVADSANIINSIVDSVDVDLWAEFRSLMELTLFKIQETPITITSIVMFVLFLVIFSVAGRVLSRLLFKKALQRIDMDPGIRFTLMRFTNYTIVFIGIVISFQFIGIDLSGLAVIFGLLSVGIGFGLQNVTSNFISGLILLIERPIKIGDRIVVNDQEGDVTEINMRSTTIRSLENISIIVPNADFISGRVINFSHGDPRIRVRVEVGVSYSSDLELVLKTLKQAALDQPDIMKDPEPVVIFKNFGESSWDLVVIGWIDNPKDHFIIASEIRMNIVRLFNEHKIEIPFPQRDINFRNTLSYKED
jgi:small-conductance mechanosensitive channel